MKRIPLVITFFPFLFFSQCSLNNPYQAGTVGGGGGGPAGWYRDFQEYALNPVTANVPRAYYACVFYDENHFGDAVGEVIIPGTTYAVLPYYKMWVGNGSGVDFCYSADGISWNAPATLRNIVTGGYHATVVYSAAAFSGETTQTPGIRYRMWNWRTSDNVLVYSESVDGINFTNYPAIIIDRTLASNNWGPLYSLSLLYRPSHSPRYEAWVDNNGFLYYITSDDCITWQRVPGVVDGDNEIRHHGKTGLDPATSFFTNGWASIVYFNGRYCLWYSSDTDGITDARSSCYRGISYAESTDGRDWSLVEVLPGMGINAAPAGTQSNAILYTTDGNTWRTSRTYCPVVIRDSGRFSGHGDATDFKMWFTGDGPGGRQIGYLTFNDP